MKNYNEFDEYFASDEHFVSMIVTERYWPDIKHAFGDDADTLTKQIYYKGKYYQCRMLKDDFCIGAKCIFSES